MSSKDNMSSSKNYEYRKKKQDKSKRFSRDKKNDKFEDCNDFVNDLPDGIFDKKSDFDSSHFLHGKNEKIENKEDLSSIKIKENSLEKDDLEETFDESYFDPVIIK